jgi:hypothetical protein
MSFFSQPSPAPRNTLYKIDEKVHVTIDDIKYNGIITKVGLIKGGSQRYSVKIDDKTFNNIEQEKLEKFNPHANNVKKTRAMLNNMQRENARRRGNNEPQTPPIRRPPPPKTNGTRHHNGPPPRSHGGRRTQRKRTQRKRTQRKR